MKAARNLPSKKKAAGDVAVKARSEQPQWCVYMLHCADGTIYTGVTNRLERRVALHSAGKAAKYTRSRTPVELAWSQTQPDRGAALSAEAKLKKLPRRRKQELIKRRCSF